MRRLLRYRVGVVGLFLILPFLAKAQDGSLSAMLHNAEKQAVELYQEGNYSASLPFLEKAVKNKPSRALWLMLAHARTSSGRAAEGLQAYEQAGGQSQVAQDTLHLFWYAQSLLGSGEMSKGKVQLSRYLRLIGDEEAANELLNSNEQERFYRDSLRYTVRPLSINTAYAEYAPGFYRGGLMYLTDAPRASWGNYLYTNTKGGSYDFYWSQLSSETEGSKPEALPSPLNSSWHEGPFTFARGGKHIVFTRASENDKLALYESNLRGKRWSEPTKLLQIAGASVAHPSFSPRGDTLYFISDMPGGYGGTDIYYVTRIREGWSAPVNLGKKVNSAGNELFPNGKVAGKLYFASNGHFGLGGLDLFELPLHDDKPIRNMGAPVNSSGDDFGLVLDASENWGFFSSNREGGKGGDDLYRLDLHIIRLKGIVYDSTNQKPLEATQIALYQNDELLKKITTSSDGTYDFTLFPGQKYQLKLSHAEFRPAIQEVNTLQGNRFGIRKKNLALERKVKMYVMGSVRLNKRERLGNASVVVIEKGTFKTDTLVANGRGSFAAELDAKSDYLFVAYCDSLAAVEHFSTPETGQASLSYYLTMVPERYHTYAIEIDVIGFQWDKPCQATLVNKLSGQRKEFQVFGGKISWQANSLEAYELCIEQDGRYASYYFEKGWRQGQRKETLFLNTFPEVEEAKALNVGERQPKTTKNVSGRE